MLRDAQKTFGSQRSIVLWEEHHRETQGAEEHRRTQACLRQEARPTTSGSDARWCEEVMPGGTFGEVMLALSRQEEKGAGVDLVIFDNSTCIVLKQVQLLVLGFFELDQKRRTDPCLETNNGFFQSSSAWPLSPSARPVPLRGLEPLNARSSDVRLRPRTR